MTWNIENFPKSDRTAGRVAEILAAHPADVVAVQEIGDLHAFQAMDASLLDHQTVAGEARGNDTRVGLIYRTSTVEITDVETIFLADSYAFPRPPLKVRATVGGVDLVVVVVHLKAQLNEESVMRRKDAVIKLDTWIQNARATGPDADIVVLGDWNDELTDTGDENVYGPMLDFPDRYQFLTMPLAEREAQDGGSYITYESFIDHILITTDATPEYGEGETVMLKLDTADPTYVDEVSDHRPVLARFRPR
jgi:endonuclease/exonuclease/phosphatase family metal-dependent hydrolase